MNFNSSDNNYCSLNYTTCKVISSVNPNNSTVKDMTEYKNDKKMTKQHQGGFNDLRVNDVVDSGGEVCNF